MVENDTFTYSIRKPANVPSHTADHSLITQERTQKLELLIHLISNLAQTLVICGPQGIGKTTLLQALHERKMDSWSYCLISGHANLSFEAIQEQVNRVVQPDKYGSQAQAFSHYQSKNKKIVLLIDDAGALVPGLITTVIQYAWTNPVLRVVFALTHDELHVKSRSDHLIDDCHFVEIPPLSEKQCGDFLQQLSTKPWARLSLNAINDGMIRNVYRHTHGIPGRIIAEIPSLASAHKGINSLWILLAAVAGLVAVALGVQWYSSVKNNTEDNVPPAASAPSTQISSLQATEASAQPKQTVQASEQLLDQYVAADLTKQAKSEAAVSEHKPDMATDALGLNQEITKKEPVADATVQEAVTSPVPDIQEMVQPAPVQEAPETATTEAPSDGVAWLNTQPPDNFTLQVMLLSKEQSIKDFMKKYPSLAQDLRYTKTMISGKEKFLLIYGSFSSAALAYKAKRELPHDFSHSLAKKIRAIKK